MSDVPHSPSPQPHPPNGQPHPAPPHGQPPVQQPGAPGQPYPAGQAHPYAQPQPPAQPYAYPQPQSQPQAHANPYTQLHPYAQPQQPPVDPRLPLPGLPFGSSYRTPHTRWWRGVLSIAIVVAAILILSTVFSFIAVAIDLALGVQSADALMSGQIIMSPALLAATNLGLVSSAALAFIAHRFVNGVRWGFIHAVVGRLRWRWLGFTLLLVAPVYALFAASSFLDPAYQDIRVDGTVITFILIIVLTTPLQAAAEEYMFRGVIQRSVGSWFRSTRWGLVVGTAVSAVVFAIAHFAQDPWLIVYYLCFGILLSVLTQRTGGLEAAIAIHTANNLFLLVVSALTGQMTEGFDRSAGVGGPVMLVPVVILAIVVAVLSLLAKRRGLARTTPEAAAPVREVAPAAGGAPVPEAAPGSQTPPRTTPEAAPGSGPASPGQTGGE